MVSSLLSRGCIPTNPTSFPAATGTNTAVSTITFAPTSVASTATIELPGGFSIKAVAYEHCSCNHKVDSIYLVVAPEGGTSPYQYTSDQFKIDSDTALNGSFVLKN